MDRSPGPADPVDAVVVRRLAPGDSFEELTALLHAAYAPLAARGMRYTASYQTVDVTRRRAERGECWIAERNGSIVGTVTLAPPGEGHGPEWYGRPGHAKFEQFGVHPDAKGRGVGRRLIEHVEARARDLGATEIACDTSEHAADLIAWYASRGYRRVGTHDWRPHVNYLSVVLSLTL